MSVEKNKALVRKMVEDINKKDLTVVNAMLDEFMAPDFVDHTSKVRARTISGELMNG